MMNRLIIIDGQSTVGKSSVANQVYKQMVGRRPVRWFHEECQDHPIRTEEFSFGDINTPEGMEKNRLGMLDLWKTLVDQVEDHEIVILEGCFLHSIDRYLLESSWTMDQIKAYCLEVEALLAPLNPLIVHLYREDIRSSFEKAYEVRGYWWRDLIFRVTPPLCLKEGEDTATQIYNAVAHEQACMGQVHQVLKSDKLSIETSKEDWTAYVGQVLSLFDLTYKQKTQDLPATDYSGTYRKEGSEDLWHIKYLPDQNQYASQLFWPCMPMDYIGDQQFEMVSFPATLTFSHQDDQVSFVVEGNYDWSHNNKRFIRED